MIKILHGSDDFLVDEELRSARAQIEQNHEGLEVQLFHAAESDLNELNALVAQPSLMWNTRLLLVYGAALLAEKDFDVGTLAERKDPNTIMILLEYSLLPPNSPILRKLDGLAEVKSFPRLVRIRELQEWTDRRIRHHGGQPRPGAAERLVDLVGNNTRQIDSEIRKLMLSSEDDSISRRAVETMVPNSATERVFQLVDAVMDGNQVNGLRILHRLLEAGESPTSLLSLLANETRRQVMAVHYLAQNVTPQEIGTRLKIRHEFIIKKLMRRAKTLSASRAARMHKLVHDVELKIKTGRAQNDVALDLLVVEMAGIRSRTP